MLTHRVERECHPKVGNDTMKEIKLQKKPNKQTKKRSATWGMFFSLVGSVHERLVDTMSRKLCSDQRLEGVTY